MDQRLPDWDDQEFRDRDPVGWLADQVSDRFGISESSRRSIGDFYVPGHEWRRMTAEFIGTFSLVWAAVGAHMVGVKFPGSIAPAVMAVAPGIAVMCTILFMGAVSGAHLNPVVSIAFALRNDFPWRRVPGYVISQMAGAMAATGVLVAILGPLGGAGTTVPPDATSLLTALAWEALLTTGLVSVVLGTSSGAQALGWGAAIGVGGYIALAGLIGAPVSGASMNPARSLGPAVVTGTYEGWWIYVLGPLAGALLAVGVAYVLRGAGGGVTGRRAASGTLGDLWYPGPLERPADPMRHHARQEAEERPQGSASADDR